MIEGSARENKSPLHLANLNTFNPKTSQHFADTYVFRGTAPKQRPFGELFIVLQIDNGTATSPQVADAIATILQYEYYRGNPSDAAKNFEDALHKTNEVLSDLAARGEIHWIGKLHGVAAIFHRDSIHVSATGRGRAYLIREAEIADIAAGLYDANRAASPMKSFENLASGDLRDGDVVLLATPGIEENITLQRLRGILRDNDPESAARIIEDRVSRDQALASSAVVLKYDRNKAQSLVGNDNKSTASQPKTAATPAAQKNSEKSGASIGSRLQSVTSKLPLLGKKTRKERQPSNPKNQQKSAEATATHASQAPVNPARANKQSARGIRVKQALKLAWSRVPKKTKLYGGLAVGVLFVFFVSMFAFTGSRTTSAERAEIATRLSRAEELEQDAAAALIFKDFTQALNLLKESEALIADISEDRSTSDQLASLRSAISGDYDKLSGSVTVDDPSVLTSISLPGEPVGLVLIDGQLLVWTTSGEAALAALDSGDQAAVEGTDSSVGAPLVAAVDEDRVVALTIKNKLVEFSNSELSELEVGGSFEPETPIALASYGSRMYVLDPGSNKLTRHSKTIAGYTQGESWVLDGTSVENAVDLAIDGNIWFLHSDGAVTKMLSGSKETFTLGGVLDPVEAPTKIVAQEDDTFLYILEPGKNRLLQFEKESGGFVKQYTSETFNSLRDMVINEAGQRAYLLNGDDIVEIKLQS